GKLATDRLRVAVRMALAQAAPGAQQGALAVGFDGAAFQSKINALYGTVREDSHVGKAPDQAVVLAGLELAAPAGEAEVEETERARAPLIRPFGAPSPRRRGEGRVGQGDRARVPQPGGGVRDHHGADAGPVPPGRGQAGSAGGR